MGFVPWVRRGKNFEAVLGGSADSPVSKENSESVNRSESQFDQSGIIKSLYRGHSGTVHGDSSACLLLVFEATPSQDDATPTDLTPTDLTLSTADNLLLLDMLKAIGLDERNVARCLINAPITQFSIDSICHSLDQPISAVLQVVTESPDITTDDQAGSRIGSVQSAVPVWQIAHPGWIQQEPALKRRAWNVLKAVRAVLDDVSADVSGDSVE